MPRSLSNPITLHALASLAPVPLLMLGALLGGGFTLLALIYLTLFAFVMDEWTRAALPALPAEPQPPTPAHLAMGLALAQFVLLPCVLVGLSGVSGLGWGDQLLLLVAAAIYVGQISLTAAHELIHRPERRLARLGLAAYLSLLFGHQVSAHRHVHHRFAATGEDPFTADLDEGFYAYAERAWLGGLRGGYEMEQALASRTEGRADGRTRRNPFVLYVAAAVAGMGLVLGVFGPGGLLAYLMLCALVQGQALLVDYVQHYGLLRRRLPGGKVESLGAEHCWNAPHWFSNLMMLNAGRHSDHHLNPRKVFADLRLPVANSAPMLPYSLPVMCLLALYPPLWRQMMTPRARAWRNAPARTAAAAVQVPAE